MLDLYAAPTMLGLLVVLCGFLLYTWQHKHDAFDLVDLLTADNGKISLTKFSRAVALVVSTWGFVALVQQGKLTETYFLCYMAVWTGYDVAKIYANKPKAPDAKPT